ncbi:HP1 family phage holin [Gallibacterium sp. AGMB14963]|uniref:HP1 family phage holin n=1 Tax=Gallibacterium faecale TaxID=3019086 RepID=UPI0022F1CBA3|nr:HP1 family phage holin [Gallibacterium sp. AGMB14963]MDA3979039.1 HP1 family phage holin [Gallibacterium sp. AGMB14963]
MNKFENMSFFGSAVAFFSGLTLNEWCSIFGILFGFCTVVLTWYYKKKDYELRRLELEIRQAEIKNNE